MVVFPLSVFFFGVATSSAETTPSFIRASETVGDTHFYDEHGRVRIFHGGNRVMKGFPWYFTDMADSDAEVALMKKMGVNVVRLGYMWSGVNPTEGYFNQSYVEKIKTIVGRMAKHGIYALLDMHQDILSSKFCLYDGAPRWVIDKSVPKHAFPWPLPGNCSRNWEANALAEASGQAYQDIYDNNHGMLDDLKAFWEYSAKQFVDIPAVIGYEIMNEPFAGNIFADPTLLLPGRAGSKNLVRMHEGVAAAIRKSDNRHLIFYEPVTWGMVFDGKIAGSGYDQVPGGPEYRNRSVFSYHYYCSTFVPDWQHKSTMRKIVCDHVAAPLVFRAVKEDLAHLGGAQMMTEGIACGDNSSECSAVMDMLDTHLFSWTSYADSQGATFQPALSMQEAWARTYAKSIAGTPTSMVFDPVSKDFELCFALNTRIQAPTEIFASRTFSYPAGLNVSFTANLKVIEDPHDEDLLIVKPASSALDGSEACVKITRAPKNAAAAHQSAAAAASEVLV